MLAGAYSSSKSKIVINAVSATWREPYLFIYFFLFRSHQQCKKSVQKEKRNLKKEKI